MLEMSYYSIAILPVIYFRRRWNGRVGGTLTSAASKRLKPRMFLAPDARRDRKGSYGVSSIMMKE
jgi:hypothetical protein